MLHRSRIEIAKTVVEPEGDVDPNREKSEQLDHRLERNGRHHAFMTFGGVQMARTE